MDEDGNEICPEPSHSISGECVPGPISCETDEVVLVFLLCRATERNGQ